MKLFFVKSQNLMSKSKNDYLTWIHDLITEQNFMLNSQKLNSTWNRISDFSCQIPEIFVQHENEANRISFFHVRTPKPANNIKSGIITPLLFHVRIPNQKSDMKSYQFLLISLTISLSRRLKHAYQVIPLATIL